MSFDCDVPAGHFSAIDTSTGGDVTITGSITPRLTRRDERWMPSATVQLKGQGTGIIAVRLTADDGKNFVARIERNKESKEVAIGKAGQPVQFRIAVTDGTAQISIGSLEAAYPLQRDQEIGLKIGCSTGNFLFENVDW
jgi:hypothetical protein